MKFDKFAFAKDYLLPLLIALIPFTPKVYEWATKPKLHYVYEATYQKNPVLEWNRHINLLISELGKPAVTYGDSDKNLLRHIGQEIYRSLPAMLSGIGFKPMDSKRVSIVNLAQSDLTNIRVHFRGCSGYDSYHTYPDALGSSQNRILADFKKEDTVTIRYDRINFSSPQASIVFYGADASNCTPLVEVQLANGDTAIGKETNLDTFFEEQRSAQRSIERFSDMALKIFSIGAILYLFVQFRGLKRIIEK